MDKSLAYIVARERGNRHPELLDCRGERDGRSRPVHLSRLRQAGPLGFVVRRQQGDPRRRTAERGGDRTAVRLEGADRGGRRRQRGRLRDPGRTIRTGRRRGGSHRALARLLPDPSGGRSPRAAPRTRRSIVPADISGRDALARPGDGEGHLSRPGMQGTGAGGHVPEGRRNGRPQRGQHAARHDLLQPLPAHDGGRGAAARRGDRPARVADVARENDDERTTSSSSTSSCPESAGTPSTRPGTTSPASRWTDTRRTASSARGPCARRWKRARDEAASLGFGLLLWDGYRPQRAVDCFLRWSKQPEDGRTKPRHYPNIDTARDVRKGLRGHEVGPQPGQHRRPDALSPGHR